MVGFLSNNESVGYYTAASTLSHILLTAVTSLGTVMLPRLSNLVKQGDMDSFHRLSKKSYNFIVTMSLPICGGLIILAPSLIRIFSGESFTPAILTLQIISPIIVAIGISNLIGIQVLYPLGKIKIVTISTLVGAIINCTLNFLLIPKYAQNGAAIATVCAEICVTLTQFIIAGKYIPFKFIDKKFMYCLVASLVMMLICYLFMRFGYSDVVNLVAVPIIGVSFYGIVMLLIKNEIMIETLQIVFRKIKK
jgi:O-antigen/teichoic acid export membrane protein